MTTNKADKNASRASNFGFGALLFTLFGWINLEVLLVAKGGGLGGHLLNSALGLYLSAVAYRRYRTWWAPLSSHAKFIVNSVPKPFIRD
jgi:hypothetical protein